VIFKRLNRTEAERVFVVFQANAAGIAADDVVALELTAASVDGVKVIQPASGQLTAVVGVADAAISNGSYGLVQVYGYRSTSRVNTTGASLTAGQALVPVAGQDYLETVASTSGVMPQFVLLESAASTGTTATVSKKIFIRSM
jgi:hypothetical protein